MTATELPTSSRARSVLVQVVDANGDPFIGATVAFALNGSDVGEVIDSRGSARIELPLESGDLSVTVSALGVVRSIDLRQIDSVVVTIPTISRAVSSLPEARCPDGTSGQPCVTCTLSNGRRVKVCG